MNYIEIEKDCYSTNVITIQVSDYDDRITLVLNRSEQKALRRALRAVKEHKPLTIRIDIS